ncbi:hypothetical protein LCGC14_1482680 [marine sediment metagenome]|uniref:Uncharacterized protein n=1 Tax=marine sediment metagenome TaxID=412755 RepID=A0A0F9LPI6_9ZZZZ
MKIETRLDGALWCFDLWIWMAITGSSNKYEFPHWDINGGELESTIVFCPVCDIPGKCEDCVIKWDGDKYIHCTNSNSPYLKWSRAISDKEHSRLALKIAELALDAAIREGG